MDKDAVKKMTHSMQVFFKTRSLLNMTKEELVDLPKEVIINCAFREIPFIWSKLPKHLQEDKDILNYLFCTEHEQDDSDDVNDGPPRRKLFCCYCKMEDINVASDNKIEVLPSDKRCILQ